MRALVTGGLGFIGSNLTNRLIKEGWDVTVVDDMSNGHFEFLDPVPQRAIPSAELFETYITRFSAGDNVKLTILTTDFANHAVLKYVRSGYFDVVFHLAANPRVEYSVENPVGTTETNIMKTVALFTAAKDAFKTSQRKVRVIFSSSCSVYGDATSYPTREGHEHNPNSPYALQKSVAEQYAQLYHKLYEGSDIVSLRYFNVFGPNQYGDSAYSTAVCSWCQAIKDDYKLRSDGDGTQSRDMVYVDSVVEANLRMALTSKGGGDVFNVGSEINISNNQILKLFKQIFEEMEIGIEIYNHPARKGDVYKTESSCAKLKEVIGEFDTGTFEQNLRKTIDWWEFK